jgi:hypothetical protein
MRRPRQVRKGVDTFYHCISRIVGGQYLLDPAERQAFRLRMHKLAKFCDIRVGTHSILSNHFHIVVEVPAKVELTDADLLKALERFYGPKHQKTLAFAQALTEGNQGTLERLRASYLARMGNLSVFIKELKEGFTKWYNAQHERYGTLWSERFKSLIIAEGDVIYVAAYVDLNGVRARQGARPEDYEFCGYAEALARDGPAREGLLSILPGDTPEAKLAHYRKFLYCQGAEGRDASQAVLDPAAILKVMKEGGEVTLGQILRLKVRYFAEGIVLGNKKFVKEMGEFFAEAGGPVRGAGPWAMKGTDWNGLTTLKKIKNPFAIPTPQK